MDGPPVDLSFKEISFLSEAWMKDPRAGPRPVKRKGDKYQSRSIRLSNNGLPDMKDLHCALSHFLVEPLLLAWLDLSFNSITHIESALCDLRELRVLYLHGNSIFILSEVDQLRVLPRLHTITLHGNMIETHKSYRHHVVTVLPKLKSMDFSAVTWQEQLMAQVWRRSSRLRANQ